jgi:hypothetical protein
MVRLPLRPWLATGPGGSAGFRRAGAVWTTTAPSYSRAALPYDRPVPPPVQARTAPRPLERPADIHLHFHGVTAEDVAAIIQRERGE